MRLSVREMFPRWDHELFELPFAKGEDFYHQAMLAYADEFDMMGHPHKATAYRCLSRVLRGEFSQFHHLLAALSADGEEKVSLNTIVYLVRDSYSTTDNRRQGWRKVVRGVHRRYLSERTRQQ